MRKLLFYKETTPMINCYKLLADEERWSLSVAPQGAPSESCYRGGGIPSEELLLPLLLPYPHCSTPPVHHSTSAALYYATGRAEWPVRLGADVKDPLHIQPGNSLYMSLHLPYISLHITKVQCTTQREMPCILSASRRLALIDNLRSRE